MWGAGVGRLLVVKESEFNPRVDAYIEKAALVK
jgi:hypothetical protein